MVALYRFFVLLAVLTGGNGVAIPARSWVHPTSEQSGGGEDLSLTTNTSPAPHIAKVEQPSSPSSDGVRRVKKLKLKSSTHLSSDKRSLRRRALHRLVKRESIWNKIKHGFQKAGKAIKSGFQKAGKFIKDKIIEPVKKKVIEPAVKFIKKEANVIKTIAIEAATVIGGGLLEAVTFGAASPLVGVIEAAGAVRTAASLGRAGAKIAKGVETAEKAKVRLFISIYCLY
jgi:hypothetical protein